MRVEIGAGERPAPGFLAVDVNPRTAGVLAGALDLPFRSGSIEEIRAVDVLEHISYRDTDRALAEWARVLRPGAPIYVQVPDADKIMRWYVAGDSRLRALDVVRPCPLMLGAQWRLLGGHNDGKFADDRLGDDWRWNAHYSLWSTHDLTLALDRAEFAVDTIRTNGHPNILCHARRR